MPAYRGVLRVARPEQRLPGIKDCQQKAQDGAGRVLIKRFRYSMDIFDNIPGPARRAAGR